MLFLAGQCRNKDDIIRAMPHLSKAVEKDPCNEGLHAALMQAHLSLGKGAEAVQVYRKATDILKDTLGITPSPALTSLLRLAES